MLSGDLLDIYAVQDAEQIAVHGITRGNLDQEESAAACETLQKNSNPRMMMQAENDIRRGGRDKHDDVHEKRMFFAQVFGRLMKIRANRPPYMKYIYLEDVADLIEEVKATTLWNQDSNQAASSSRAPQAQSSSSYRAPHAERNATPIRYVEKPPPGFETLKATSTSEDAKEVSEEKSHHCVITPEQRRRIAAGNSRQLKQAQGCSK